jgi:hypothetical protein
MKILRRGHLSIRDGSAWTPGEWREESGAVAGQSCGVGLHSLFGPDPLRSPVFCWPCEVWEDECEGELGRDGLKARYRRQRIVREITDEFSVIVRVNEFIASLASVPWLRPDRSATPPAYMRVERMTLAAARDAAVEAAWSAAWSAARAAAWDAAVEAAWSAARAAWSAARAAVEAAWDAARAAAGEAYALLVSDLPAATTWLHRWWGAWQLGYYPIREDGETLVVADVSGAEGK